jgi:hypothetical protein
MPVQPGGGQLVVAVGQQSWPGYVRLPAAEFLAVGPGDPLEQAVLER